MKESTILAGLILVSTAIIGALVYLALRHPERIIIYNEHVRPSFQTHHWGYNWRPWWRKYNGLPGLPGLSTVKPDKPSKPATIPRP